MGRPRKDLTGRVFGRLKVIQDVGEPGHSALWECLCACGKTIRSKDIGTHRVNSCGCLKSELRTLKNLKHNACGTVEYRTWVSIKRRCHNPNTNDYKNYGGRGITVCQEWLESFEVFFREMGFRPSDKHSIDRINNEGGYSPDNCKWSTRAEQNMNTRRQVTTTKGRI